MQAGFSGHLQCSHLQCGHLQCRLVLVVIFFIFEIELHVFCSVVALSALVHDVDTMHDLF